MWQHVEQGTADIIGILQRTMPRNSTPTEFLLSNPGSTPKLLDQKQQVRHLSLNHYTHVIKYLEFYLFG